MIVIKVNYTTDAPIIKVNYDDAPIYISTTVDATYISVDYGSGAATNAVWGDITGTLSDQTDLQNALDDKVPYTGATGNVDLGEYELKAGQLTLDTSPTGTASVGTTRWNDTIGSSETTLKGGSVILKNGVDLVARVVNKVTPNTTLTKAAYQAVRVSGAQGQRLAVAFAQANNDNNSADTIGLVTETIATNQEGFIMTVGNLEDINTTGSLQGETWADGDVLYLSPTVAGAITNIKPVAPQHLVVIGYVEYAHANHGKIYVKVMNGWELGELHDVDTTGATAGQVLKYNGTIWTPSSDLDTGITSLNGLTALTQTFATGTSGTDFNISSATSTHTFNLPTASATNRGLVSSSDWSTFNAKIGGTLATGQVAFGSAANTIAGSNNLFWDNTNGRLGIGTNAPTTQLQISATDATLNVNASNVGGIARITTSGSYLIGPSGEIATIGGVTGNQFGIFRSSTTFGISGYYGIRFFANGEEKARVFQGGNWLFQNGGTFTDGGQRLQVQGDAFIKGSGNTSGTTALTVQNSDGTNLFRVNNSGYVLLSGSNGLFISQFTTSRGTVAINGTNTQFYNYTTSQDASVGAINIHGDAFVQTSGAANTLFISKPFNPTSGTATYSTLSLSPSSINQTGGANGITRGLYVQPTLTAAADWRSIEWSNNSGWGLYGAGSANNYLAGALGIGSISITGINLFVGKNITGSTTSYGIHQGGFVLSDVTGNAYGLANTINTANSLTLTNYFHFRALQGSIGTGNSITAQYGIYINDLTAAATNYGFVGNLSSGTGRWNLYMSGTADNYMAGSLGIGSTTLTGYNLRVSKNLTGGGAVYGIMSEGSVQSDVTAANYYQTFASVQNTAFTLLNLRHFQATGNSSFGSATVTNQFGFLADSALTGATNNFGFYGNIAAGTNRWNLYMNGTANNYMAGSLGIGSTSLGGNTLRIDKNITGATTYFGIRQSPTIQSDVTSAFIFYGTETKTVAASFTITDVIYFQSSQGLLGAGSSITNQYGFRANSNLTGATNNYGFYGDIASNTGRWNLYMSGTAANYLNGNTIIGGSAVDGGQKLQVNGDSIMKGSGATSATTALTVQNSSSTNLFSVDNSGLSRFGAQLLTFSGDTNPFRIIHRLDIADGIRFDSIGNTVITSGSRNTFRILENFSPTSGTGSLNVQTINPTINQTGGANGATRGLYINPTLTAAADWRSIETSNNSGWSYYGAGTANSYYGGHISIGTTSTGDWLNIAAGTTAKAQINLAASTAPTSPQNGDIWFDGTDLKMRIGGVTKTFTLV